MASAQAARRALSSGTVRARATSPKAIASVASYWTVPIVQTTRKVSTVLISAPWPRRRQV